MDAEKFGEYDFYLWMLVFQSQDIMLRARRKELVRYQIEPGQSGVLFAVHALKDKATSAEIARLLFRESQSVCEILTRMERKGLIRRDKSPGQTKRIKIVMTEYGKNIFKETMKRQSIHDVIAALSPREQKQLESCLIKIRNQALKEINDGDL
jgi:MarR family transcriptional regulator, organic hydroperoxide resistance regulator